jgi:hypothetical protein
VLGVFFTAGWAAILVAGGTLAGGVITQAGNAWKQHMDGRTKRDDRQHERALDYEKRAWQAKSDALKRLISACRFVKLQAKLNTENQHRRAATIRALDQFRDRVGDEDGISEITAYAAEPVRKGLDEVLEQVDVQRREHRDQLSTLRRIGTQIDALFSQPTATDNSGAELARTQRLFEQHAELWRQRGQALDAINAKSALDVDGVIALCDRVIDAARKDLQGRDTE